MNLTDVEQRANAQHPGRGSELLSNLEAVGLIKVIGLAPHTQLVQITDAGRHALAADQPEPSVRRGRIWCTFGYAWVDIRSIWLRHVPEHQRYWFRAASGCGVLMAAMIGAAAALAAAGKAPDDHCSCYCGCVGCRRRNLLRSGRSPGAVPICLDSGAGYGRRNRHLSGGAGLRGLPARRLAWPTVMARTRRKQWLLAGAADRELAVII